MNERELTELQFKAVCAIISATDEQVAEALRLLHEQNNTEVANESALE